MPTKFARVRFAQMLGPDVGQLIVRGQSWSMGTVTAHRLDDEDKPTKTYYADYETYKNEDDEEMRIALFPCLPTGNYLVCKPAFTRVGHRITIYPADVREIELT